MLQVLIVDDHLDQRELLNFLLNKHDRPWKIHNAANGKEGLAIFAEEKIDLVITDIKMPFIDGIELAETLRHQNSMVPILFISGYDDFQYVKKALDLQVVNYLLKPINPEEFYTQLEKMILLNIEQNAEAALNKRVILQDILIKLLQGTTFAALQSEEKDILLPNLSGIKFLLALDVTPHESAKFANYANSHENQQLLFVRTSLTRFIYFLDAPTKFEAFRQKNQLLEQIQQQFSGDFETEISEEINDVDQLFTVYQNLDNQINLNFYQQESRESLAEELPTADPNKEEAVLQEVKKNLQQRDFTSFSNSLKTYLKLYQDSACETPSIVRFFFANLYRTIIEVTMNDSTATRNDLKIILEATSYQEINDIFENLIQQTKEQFEALSDTTNNYVAETKAYILNHYPEELNLELLANNVHLSPKYLSDLFKREENIGITKYLNAIRMEKAEELLTDTHYRVNDISKQVGFNSYSYFIKQFQKKNGVTPERYRKLAQTKDDTK